MTNKDKLLSVLTALGETTDLAEIKALQSKAMGLASKLTEAETETYEKLLPVPYFSQLDNGDSAAYTCNSSSCFMLAAFAKPELVKSEDFCPDNGDYEYYRQIVLKYGDTTSHEAQTAALAELGVPTTFHTDFSIDKICSEIDAGRPVAAAILHKGDLSAELPYGGHIVVAVGYGKDDSLGDYLLVHDPNGELMLRTGVYDKSASGSQLRYSFRNFSRRFETDSAGYYTPGANGWARTLDVD